uniref:Dynein light chain 1 n=1 Tax=Schistocephalus solidus TaxID=70667 RepID=A0A0X3NJH6_SCHSO
MRQANCEVGSAVARRPKRVMPSDIKTTGCRKKTTGHRNMGGSGGCRRLQHTHAHGQTGKHRSGRGRVGLGTKSQALTVAPIGHAPSVACLNTLHTLSNRMCSRFCQTNQDKSPIHYRVN